MLTFETNKLVPAKPDEVLEAVVEVLKALGWDNLDVHRNSFSLTAESFNGDRVSPNVFFVSVVTCVPAGERTEVLLSISTNDWEFASQRGGVIMRTLVERLEKKQGTDVKKSP